MAFELKMCVLQSSCEVGFYVFDKSGVFDPLLNPTGYNAPNIATSDVDTAVLDVTYAGATTPVSLNVFPNLPSSDVNSAYLVTPAALGLTEMPSGLTRVTYIITGMFGGSPFTYTTTTLVLFDCELACCVSQKLIDAAEAVTGECGCNDTCREEKIKTALFLEAALEGARAATCSGLVDQVETIVDYLETKCGETPCSGC